jgi:hypothetical protein
MVGCCSTSVDFFTSGSIEGGPAGLYQGVEVCLLLGLPQAGFKHLLLEGCRKRRLVYSTTQHTLILLQTPRVTAPIQVMFIPPPLINALFTRGAWPLKTPCEA